MFCSHCRTPVETAHKYCPACGARLAAHEGSSSFRPRSDGATTDPSSRVVKKRSMPLWFKVASFAAVLALVAVTAGILFTESWVDVVDHQLMALRDKDIAKAYSYTSQDFQTATPLEAFQRFIETYPLFMHNQSAHFHQRSIEHNLGTLRGHLTSQDHTTTPVEYKLIKEGNAWKILSVRLIKPDNIPNPNKAAHAEDLIESAKGQLKYLQEQKFSDAYQRYSAQEFKDTSSEEAFTDFVKRYPILNQPHTEIFHQPSVHNGIGTLSAVLESDQTALYVKYYFIEEDQQWKIWSMRVLGAPELSEEKLIKEDLPQKSSEMQPSEPAASVPPPESGASHGPKHSEYAPPPMSFGAICLGDSVGENGQILHPMTLFQSSLRDLYVDIVIKNGIRHSMVYLNLQHLDSDSSIPNKMEIEEQGNTVLMTTFCPPAAGWPQGRYKLLAALSSGPTSTIEFEVL